LLEEEPSERLVMLGRYMRMARGKLLAAFKKNYHEHGQYFLVPAFGPKAKPEMDTSLAIKKKAIRFLLAAELGDDDQERIVLEPD
jgi:hypothetical protein